MTLLLIAGFLGHRATALVAAGVACGYAGVLTFLVAGAAFHDLGPYVPGLAAATLITLRVCVRSRHCSIVGSLRAGLGVALTVLAGWMIFNTTMFGLTRVTGEFSRGAGASHAIEGYVVVSRCSDRSCNEVARQRLDARGRFSVPLSAGTYTVAAVVEGLCTVAFSWYDLPVGQSAFGQVRPGVNTMATTWFTCGWQQPPPRGYCASVACLGQIPVADSLRSERVDRSTATGWWRLRAARAMKDW